MCCASVFACIQCVCDCVYVYKCSNRIMQGLTKRGADELLG